MFFFLAVALHAPWTIIKRMKAINCKKPLGCSVEKCWDQRLGSVGFPCGWDGLELKHPKSHEFCWISFTAGGSDS